MSKKKDATIKEFIHNRAEYIEQRISEVERRISSINAQLLALETILHELDKKINNYGTTESDYTKKSRLIRWYIEDIKIYNELNDIRTKYEKLLMDYNAQLINSKLKLEDIEMKKKKLDNETSEMEEMIKKIYEEMDSLKINIVSAPDTNPEEEDKIYKL